MIGFYFAKELLGAGHAVTILTVGEESSDKMKKPPFNRFSVNHLCLNSHINRLLQLLYKKRRSSTYITSQARICVISQNFSFVAEIISIVGFFFIVYVRKCFYESMG